MLDPVVYIGFSTVDQPTPDWVFQNVELVKRDLLNTFRTRLGERVMRPEYGTRIYDLLMDPFDGETRNAIEQDVERVISEEPRVELVSQEVTELDQVIRIEAVLSFTPGNSTDTLFIEYDRRNQERP